MLEVRYNNESKQLTAWCGDEKQFGNLKREGHTVIILDIPIPKEPREALLYNETTQNLVDNPDYIEPKPPFDVRVEIDGLKAEIKALKGK